MMMMMENICQIESEKQQQQQQQQKVLVFLINDNNKSHGIQHRQSID